jgi:hypothetical protein
MHVVFIFCETEFAFWGVLAFDPVVPLDVIPTELRHVFGQPDLVHFWVSIHCFPKTVPPD